MPQTCGVDRRGWSGAPGISDAEIVIAMLTSLLKGCPRLYFSCRPGQAKREPGPIRRVVCVERSCSTAFDQKSKPVVMGPRFRGDDAGVSYPATSLMRAINSSTAFSTGTFSLTTRFIAFAQTFSLLRIVNFQFLVKSNGCVPPVNWL